MTSYETVEGTVPTTHGKHEPRTVKKVIVPDRFHDDHDLVMMTEIGDGVFVAWTNCRRCNNRVYGCKCPEGPQEPPYMKKWRDERFAKDLNTRPDPSYDLLDSVLEWARERGYTVTKPVELTEEEWDEEAKALSEEPTVFEQVTGEKPREPQATDPIVEAADDGLNAALAKVREANGQAQENYDDIPDDF